MDIENIDEVKDLLIRIENVESAIQSIKEINSEDGGSSSSFALVDRDTDIPIRLLSLKAEVLDSIGLILSDQHHKITSRLREL